MLRKSLSAVLLLSYLFCSGCPAVIMGAGAGAGVYTYIKGELKRPYAAPFDRVLKASLTALESLKIKVITQTTDGRQADIRAEGSDRTPITLKVVELTPEVSEVAVRSGMVGVWDKQLSELIHASITKKL